MMIGRRSINRYICIVLAVVSATALLSGCGRDIDSRQNDTLQYASFRDIPGVTDKEIEEVEALISGRDSFKYGAMLATEAFVTQEGTLAGFSREFCRLLSNLFEIDFILELYEWDVLLDDLDSGAIDFTGELTRTEERMQMYKMTSPIAERMLRIFTRTDTIIRSENDVNGLRIGFLTDSITAESIIKTYNLQFTGVDVDNYETAAEMIVNGEIDAFVDEAVADPVFSGYESIRSQFLFHMIHAPVSMTTANPALAPLISVVDKYIASGGLDRLYELYKEGESEYIRDKLGRSFTDEEKAFIDDLAQRGAAVSVAFEHDNYPINFFNEEDGAFEGISVDVINEIGRLTGIRFEPAVTKATTWEEIYETFSAGEIDIVGQLLYTEARKDLFMWSSVPYAQSYYALMSVSDYPNLEMYQVARTSVGSTKGSAKIDVFHELFPDHDQLIVYDTQYECLDALERGEIDLVMASEYMLLTQINYREKSGFKINIKLDTPLSSYFGFHRDETVLRSIIDKAQQYVQTEIIEISWTQRNFDYTKKLAEERVFSFTIFLIIMLVILIGTILVLLKNINLSRKLKEMANFDVLTGICNRRFFMELAEVQAARSSRTNIKCYIAMFDLDHFKAVNDTYGHQAGDAVLKDVAQRVKNTIRPYDILGRYGGEEFTLMMTDVKEIDKEVIISAVERIRLEIQKSPVEFEGKSIPVSASFGISYAVPVYDMPTAIKYADEALYEAKETGRNKVVFFEKDR